MHDDSLAHAKRPAGASAAPPGQPPASDWRPLLALLAWCCAFLAIRLAEHGTLERDEAEIVYLTQQLRLGYGTQPPLYAWLQLLFFEAFGVNRFALLILKDLVLAAGCIAMFRAARLLLGRRGALAVTASLALFPQVGWEALRIQTHSVLMTAIACATLWLYFPLLRRPTLARHIGFGLLCGLGLQTKYNYGVFLAGLLGASLLVREHRELLWKRKAWAAVLAWAAVCWRRRALWRGRLHVDWSAPASRFFACLYGVCGLLLAALALTGEVGTIKERWMIPLLFSLPLGLCVMFPALDREAIHADILRFAAVVALGLLLLLPARTWLGPAFGKIMTRHHPYAELADAVERRCPRARTVVTESLLSAGNLRFARPALTALLLEDARREATPLPEPAALVTHAQDAPSALAVFHAAWPEAKLAPREVLGLALEDGSGRRMDFMLACVAGEAPR